MIAKKRVAGITATIALMGVLSTGTAFAAGPHGTGYIDADGDGVCDNRVSLSVGQGYGRNANADAGTASAQGQRGAGFVDSDGDGVCDNAGNGNGAGAGGGRGHHRGR